MKKLIIVRHAKTEQLYDYSKTDFERKLLPKGKKDSELISKILIDKDITPDKIITSTAKRAMQTAKIFAKQMNFDSNCISTEQFIYDGYTTGDMINYLSGFDNKLNSIMLVGHNPDIGNFTSKLVSAEIWHFPTCCASVVSFDVESWKEIEVNNGILDLHIHPSMFKD